jgi:hypothetical protein
MSATEQEIYDQSIAEQTQNVPETPVEAPTEAEADRARDDKGRFKSATPEPTSQVVQEPTPQPEVEKPSQESEARVPSWRLAEESQRRRDAEQALNEIRNELRQMRQAPTPQAPQQPEQQVDIFADPEGFVKTMQSRFDQSIANLRLENKLQFARMSDREAFDQAYNGYIKHMERTEDPAVRHRILASPDPGEALVQWWKEQELHRELGGTDLKSFLDKQREEWLKDPSVQAKVIEAFKATQGQPNNKLTNLPPSLSQATAARSAHAETVGTGGKDLYSYATAKG